MLLPTQEEARRKYPVGSEIEVHYDFDSLQAYSSTAEPGTSLDAVLVFVVAGFITYFCWRKYRNDSSTVHYNGPVVSFVICTTALMVFVIGIAIDASVRQEHPAGTSVPVGWAIVLVVMMVASIVGWFAGGLFAILSLAARSSRSVFAWLALTVNAIGAGILAFLN